jgi:signal transduction histidine kinase
LRESDFLSVVSHELRTPITVIVGLAALLSDRREDMSGERIDECLEQIRHQGERMAGLVNDLLELSQLDGRRVRVDLSAVDLAAAVTLALEDAPSPPTTVVELAVPSDLWVVADPGRLEQVLVNLLTNAYRYGGPAVRIEAVRSSDHALLTVSDNGDGVAAELVSGVFEEYSRGATAGSHGGYGLGLAIVRGLVEAFGGRVWYDPGEPRGARFNLTLPLSAGDLAVVEVGGAARVAVG